MTEAPSPNDEAATEGESLDVQLQQALAERDEYKGKWARAMADLDNFRRRIQREMEEDRKYLALPLLKALLPGLDGLDRTLAAAETSKNADDLITGVKMVQKQFESSLGQFGVQAIAAVGLEFDPHIHEAITQMPSADHPPMTVLQDVEKGYLLHDRVVRPSKVIVASQPQP
jgi:molecular chaperone GrpE